MIQTVFTKHVLISFIKLQQLLLIFALGMEFGVPHLALASSALSPPIRPDGSGYEQTASNNAQVAGALSPQEQHLEEMLDRYLSQMSVADKVGQLFVISFEGSEVAPDSDIAELIYVYRVGGVALSPGMRNFTNDKATNTPENVARLVNQLQAISYGVFLPDESALTLEGLDSYRTEGIPPSRLRALARSENLAPLNIPLFVAVEQQGDNLPNTALRQGFTELPSPLALGATWQPPLARKVGAIVGKQLGAVGVNMLLGPNLDVVDQPLPDKVGGLGLFSFGGDPSWVSRMGRAYISGVHDGGNGRVLTIARHFPGQGGSDRIPDIEIPTIQSSEQDLRRTDFPPFIAVTRDDSSIMSDDGDLGSTDGLMSSHARYASQQGAVTEGNPRPISLANQLFLLLQEPDFAPWRVHGLVMSNALGVPAIRKTFEPAPNGFLERRIALEAFNAGHDLLFLGEFGETGNWQAQKQNITETIQFFRGRYETNAEFQANVDAAVRRILRAKLRLYVGNQSSLNALGSTAPPSSGVSVTETSSITGTSPVTGTSNITESATITQAQGITDVALPTDQPSVEITNTAGLSPTVDPAAPAPTATEALTTVAVVTAPTSITESGELSSVLPITVTEGLSFTYPITLVEAIPLQNVLITEANLDVFSPENLALANADIREVSRSSITLLAPEAASLSDPLPDPPQADEKILIFTNSRLQQECADCTAEVAVPPDALADIMRSLYGIEATAQISDALITSLAFSDLMQLLDQNGEAESAEAPATQAAESEERTDIENLEEQATPVPENSQELQTAPVDAAASQDNLDKNAKTALYIEEADWIIFAMLDVTVTDPNSVAVQRFLGERGDLLSNKRVVVLALHAPYFLDATEVSRLTAYLGVNSKIRPFLEQAVLTLFKANLPVGAPPVSAQGTHFSNLSEQLQPNPNQLLPLTISMDDTTIAPAINTDAAEVKLKVGDLILMQVGPILDGNNNPVSDGTPVEFQLLYESGNSELVSEVASTRGGTAQREVTIERSGVVRISAISRVSDGAQLVARSDQYTFSVSENPALVAEAATAAAVVAEQTPEESVAQAQSGVAEANATPQDGEPETLAGSDDDSRNRNVHLQTLIMAILTIAAMQSFLLIMMARTQPRVQLIRNMLWAVIMGLLAYIVYFIYIVYGANVVPGASWVHAETYPWGTVIIVFMAMLAPLLWLQLRHE